MSKLVEFLSGLHERGVRLWVKDNQLNWSATTGTMTPEDFNELRAHKREVIDLLAEMPAGTALARDYSGSSRTVAPLTLQQEEYWAFLQTEASWNLLDTFALRLDGPLDAQLLRRSLEQVVHRHSALRTRIALVNEVPTQIVDEATSFPLTILHPAEPTDDAPIDRAKRIVNEMARRSSDLTVGPVFDAYLLKLTEQQHVLVWSIHHIISDGSALMVLFRELWQLYAQGMQGRQSSLTDVPAQYVDYAVWQREVYHAWLQNHPHYWTERLAGAEGIWWPPAQCTPDPSAAGVGGEQISLGKELRMGLSNLAKQAGTPLSLTVLSIYAAVVAQWCAQRDFMVATTVTGRDRSEHQGMIGYFAYCRYLRIRYGGMQTAWDLLHQVREDFQRALLPQDFGRQIMQTPLLHSGTMFQWFPFNGDDIAGVPAQAESEQLDFNVQSLPVERPKRGMPGKWKVMITFMEYSDDIRGGLGYRTDVFSKADAVRFVTAFRSRAELFVHRPHAVLSEALQF